MMFRLLITTTVIISLLVSWTYIENSEENEVVPVLDNKVNYDFSLKHLVDSLNVQQKNISILIDKSDFVLKVYNKEKVLKSYPVALGENPIDDKRMQGDRCTPEGSFKMNSKYPHKSWKYFVWVNYPTPDSWKKHNASKANGSIPSNAKIGGEIGIHGVPEGCDYLIDKGINWTWGCISLKRQDIADLYPYIAADTKIEIVP